MFVHAIKQCRDKTWYKDVVNRSGVHEESDDEVSVSNFLGLE